MAKDESVAGVGAESAAECAGSASPDSSAIACPVAEGNAGASAATAKKLRGSVVAVVVLVVCLAIVTFALFYSAVSVRDSLFHTGDIGINLNGGEPVIREEEFIFEPGMTVAKDFYVENNGTWEEYWRLYLDDVSGGLADVLQITIADGGEVLYSGTAAGLSGRQSAAAGDGVLAVGERRELTMTFHYPESAGNEGQGQSLAFSVRAEATQAKNNPDKQFG